MRRTRKTSAPNTPDSKAGNLPATIGPQSQPQSPTLESNSAASTGTPVNAAENQGTRKRSAAHGQNALGISSLLHRLQAVDHTITVDVGLYLVELAALDLPTTRANGVDLPLVHIRASDAKGSPVPITQPDGIEPWLGGAGGTVFVEAPLGGARVTLTAYAPEGQQIPRGRLTVRRLEGATMPPALGRSVVQPIPTRDTAAAAEVPRADDRRFAEFIERSGLFDVPFYLQYNHDAATRGGWAALDYVVRGDAEGRKPNPYFDPVWYSKKYFSHPPAGGALRDYVRSGECEGRKPCAVFDPSWYAATYGLELNNGSALTHYLKERRSNTFSPNSYFDIGFYLDANPEIAEADVDAFAHWLHWGIHESRKASPKFNAEFVWQQYLNNNRDFNAFEKFMDIGVELGWDATGANASDRRFEMYRELKRNCAPGPRYEPLILPPSTDRKSCKILAFYLPRFHAIPENDAWWGTGFTEWHNIPRGVPRYAGHYQPRIPRDFGFYNLDSPGIMRRQVELARQMGLFGFCFYYYNFGGHRLLEKPVDAFLADSSLDCPFCLIWANENWTRRWDGREREMLIRQDYRPEEVPALIADIARHMHEPRYIRAGDGRPLLIVYRADVIPECGTALEAWRSEFRSVHRLDPLIVMGQTFGMTDPRPLGFDGALEFPPHNLGANLNLLNRNRELDIYDVDFQGFICDYTDIVAASMAVAETDFPVIKTAFPSWDNDARRQGTGMSFANSTPQAFQRWLEVLIERAEARPFFGEPFVCVNAWNEWCEGAYLEPDIHFGHAYLNAVARAMTREKRGIKATKIVLLGDDARSPNTQLLHIGRTLRRCFGIEVSFVLLHGGELLEVYSRTAITHVIGDAPDAQERLTAAIRQLKGDGYHTVITNSLTCHRAIARLHEPGFAVSFLLNQLPETTDVPAQTAWTQIYRDVDTIIFPTTGLREIAAARVGSSTAPVVRVLAPRSGSHRSFQNRGPRIATQQGRLYVGRIPKENFQRRRPGRRILLGTRSHTASNAASSGSDCPQL